MRMIYLFMFVAALMLAGCEKDAKSIEEREERDPLVKTGQTYMEQQRWAEAEKASPVVRS